MDSVTIETHRAIESLREELEAVDWYRQRADASTDTELKAILLHNMDEDLEHAVMILEWLRRHNDRFNHYMERILFTDSPITEVEHGETVQGSTSSTPDLSIGSLRADPANA